MQSGARQSNVCVHLVDWRDPAADWVVRVLLHLVRHGRPVIEPGRPASDWRLDDAAAPDVQRLRGLLDEVGSSASWYSSDEPKALATARALSDGEIEADSALREAGRDDWFPSHDEFRAAVVTAFEAPHRAARRGWEPLDQTRRRIRRGVATIVARSTTDLVLAGHGTAWTLLVSDITDRAPDVDSWCRLTMPDLCTLDTTSRSVVRAWGTWQAGQSPIAPRPSGA
jgi:broad specificity phosphatase PhoE